MMLSTASAADWQLSKQVALEGNYSDNINLDDTDKVSDFFATFTPGIVLQKTGRYLNVDLAYSPRFVNYISESNNNRIDNNLQLNAQSELIENHFFVDLVATADQTYINAFDARGDADNNTDNIQTTYSYALSPLLRSNVGGFADAELALEQTGVFYSNQGADSYGYGASLAINADRDFFGRLLWGVLAETERVEYDSDQNDFSTFSVTVGYQLTRRLAVDLFAGYEDNSYASPDATSGVLWGAGFTWIPTSRTELSVQYGETYFGTTSNIEFRHQRKRSVWQASYTRQLATARSQVASTPVYSFEDPFGDPTLPDVADTAPVSVETALPTTTVFIADQLNAEYTLLTRRSTFTANGAYVRRDYGGGDDGQTAIQLGLNVTHDLSTRLSALAGLNWQQTDQGTTATTNNADTNDNLALRAGLRRSLNEHWNVNALYLLQTGTDYTENRFTLGVAADW
jgi:uncharacterized protein (PEP-CTERM system associated)